GYARRFGFIEEEAAIKSKSGTMTVWRWARIKNSYRLPNINTNGLAATVGGNAETPMPGRGYAGNGVNMPIDGAANSINTFFGDNKAFNEWTLTAPPAGGGGDPVHQHVDLNAYRTKHASVTSSWTGYVSMANNGAIKNYCAVWDAYRMRLPPGLPNLPNLIANTIAAQAVGTSTHDVGVAVENAITGHGANPDVALNGGVAVIPNYPSNDPDDYENWLDGRWDTEYNGVLDALVPAESKPEKVNVLRWPFLHEHEAWIGYDDPNDTAVYSGSMT